MNQPDISTASKIKATAKKITMYGVIAFVIASFVVGFMEAHFPHLVAWMGG